MKFEELFQPKPGSVAAEMQKTINGLNKEIKELRAENAALRKAKEMVELERCEMMRSMSLAQNQSEQLRADKERLDWLTNTGCWLTFPVLSRHQNWKQGTARDVIDAARKEAQP